MWKGLSPNWKMIFALMGVGALLFMLWFFRIILLYVVCAVVLSFVVEPLADACKYIRFKNWRLPSWARALLSMSLFVGLLISTIALFAPVVREEMNIIGALDLRILLQKWGLEAWVDTYQQTGIAEMVVQQFSNAIQLQTLQQAITGLVSWVGNLVIGIFAVVFIAFFFLKDGFLFTRIVFSLTPERHMDAMKNIMEHTHDLLRRYFIGVAVQSLIMSLMIGLALFALGVKNALLIGLFAGLINVIPYIGPMIGAGFALVVAVTTALQVNANVDVWPIVVQIVAVFGIAQQIDGFVVQPLILGNSVKAHPLEVFIVVLMAGMVGGVGGMIAAIPVYTIIRVIAREFFSAFKPVESLTRDL